MALVNPKNLTFHNYTESEKELFIAFKELNEDFSIFFSVPWQKKSNNGRFFINGECDFVIINRELGFVTIEVKGGKNLRVHDNTWYLELNEDNCQDSDDYITTSNTYERQLKRNPTEQAKDSMYFFLNFFKQKTGRKYSGLFGHAVAFPNFMIKNDITMDTPKEIIIDNSDMNHLPDKIAKIFDYYSSKRKRSYLARDHNDFIELLKVRRHFKITQSKIIEKKSSLFEMINRVQDSYLDLIESYKKVLITGGAGTGKTFCAVKKAKRYLKEGNKVLFLCFNKNLSEYLKLHYFVSEEHIDCYNFHLFIKNIVGSDKFGKLFSSDNGKLSGLYNELNSGKYRIPHYGAIIIDEGQDFSDNWFNCIKLFGEKAKNNFFYVFYDEEQNIYDGQIERIINHFNLFPFHLKENLRNSAEIQEWITEQTGLGRNVKPSQLEGVKPVLYEVKNKTIAVKRIESLLSVLINQEFICTSQIIILSDRKLNNSILSDKSVGKYRIFESACLKRFDDGDREIRFATVQSFKGLEADVVIYLQHDVSNNIENNRIKYVGYSRARYFLYIIKVNTAE